MRALPKMPFDTIIRYFLVFMEIGSWLKTRLLENQETKLQSLRQLLVEGEQSGDADYDLDSFINELDSENIR
ncbi:putative transcriptional regulator [Vibrio cholerae]|nr:putative transcriptional regulator [Vibrio cholerae]